MVADQVSLGSRARAQDYYRKDVLEDPDGDSHANIRAFMKGGWDSVKFPKGLALAPKAKLGD